MIEENKKKIKATMDTVGGKWKPDILAFLVIRPHRFSELSRLIPEISKKMLVQQLRKLEDDGIVYRHVENIMPPKVEYSLTEYGQTLCPVFEVLAKWGEKHLKFLEG